MCTVMHGVDSHRTFCKLARFIKRLDLLVRGKRLYVPRRAVEGSLACPAMARQVFEKLGFEIHAKSMLFGPRSAFLMKNRMIPW